MDFTATLTEVQSIAAYANRVASTWKVGRRQ
jgi:uncharacterized membrane protein YgcG